jgi:hypothetical protein
VFRFFQPVLDQEVHVVALIEDLAAHVRIERHKPPDLAVLLGDELLIERCDLDVEVEVGQVEVGCEALARVAVPVPFDIETGGFVAPRDLIEVEQLGELALAVVGEVDALVRPWTGRLRFDLELCFRDDQPSSALPSAPGRLGR